MSNASNYSTSANKNALVVSAFQLKGWVFDPRPLREPL